MRTNFVRGLLRQLATEAEPDGELVRRHILGDAEAFPQLARRHAPLVWGVCRQLLPEADAEDAFQATFLLLARKAHAVKNPAALGAWLHTVAVRVAKNARRAAARRTTRERKAATAEASRPVADAAWDGLLAAVHEEVAALPESLRVAFILCDLEGVSPARAAERLGWKAGTLSGRLTRARQALLARLSARGLAPAVAGAGLAALPLAAPARLVEVVVKFASPACAVPAGLVPLTYGVFVMGASRWIATGLVAASLLLTGWGVRTGAQSPEVRRAVAALALASDDFKPAKPKFTGQVRYVYPKSPVTLATIEDAMAEGEAGGWTFAGSVRLSDVSVEDAKRIIDFDRLRYSGTDSFPVFVFVKVAKSYTVPSAELVKLIPQNAANHMILLKSAERFEKVLNQVVDRMERTPELTFDAALDLELKAMPDLATNLNRDTLRTNVTQLLQDRLKARTTPAQGEAMQYVSGAIIPFAGDTEMVQIIRRLVEYKFGPNRRISVIHEPSYGKLVISGGDKDVAWVSDLVTRLTPKK